MIWIDDEWQQQGTASKVEIRVVMKNDKEYCDDVGFDDIITIQQFLSLIPNERTHILLPNGDSRNVAKLWKVPRILSYNIVSLWPFSSENKIYSSRLA